jgi:hypothetical protein
MISSSVAKVPPNTWPVLLAVSEELEKPAKK